MKKHETIIVDASNVAYAEKTKDGRPKVKNIMQMCIKLEQLGYKAIQIIDASLRYEIDDVKQLDAIIEKGIVKQAPTEIEADYFIIEIAKIKNSRIISNDKFSPYLKENPWLPERRIPFMVIDSIVILYNLEPLKNGTKTEINSEV